MVNTSGSFLRNTTSNRASRVFSKTIFPSLEAKTTPPELNNNKIIRKLLHQQNFNNKEAVENIRCYKANFNLP